MRGFLDQAEIFLTAAACMAAGFGLLYLALGLYGMVLNKVLRYFCTWGALFDFIMAKRNRDKWWTRLPSWWDRMTSRDRE